MQGPSLSDFADRLNQIMPLVMRKLSRYHENELYKGKITFQQFLVLELLYQEKELTMSQIAQAMNVSTPAISGIVDRLVRERYVERVYSREDRRVIKVRLTSKGNDLVKRINDQKRRLAIKIFEKISEEDRKSYLRILTQIKDIILKENNA